MGYQPFILLALLLGLTEVQSGCAPRVRQYSPRGGPLTGGTKVTITGDGFVDLGDVKCKFGKKQVVAYVITNTIVECTSPPLCEGTICLSKDITLEVTMNGVSFSTNGLFWSYYDLNAIQISRLQPNGGPLVGDTTVVITGSHFRDYGGGIAGVHTKGAQCKFGSQILVNATVLDAYNMKCVSPTQTTAGPYNLEVTFNYYEEVGTLTALGTPFEYYDDAAFTVAGIHPIGGPTTGETYVTLSGTGFQRLRGCFCQFGAQYANIPDRWPKGVTEPQDLLLLQTVPQATPASMISDTEMKCFSPPWLGTYDSTTGYSGSYTDDKYVASVYLYLNGQQVATSTASFTYYDATVAKIISFDSTGGPLTGDTNVLIEGLRLADYGELKCRFSADNARTPASISDWASTSDTHMRCFSPPHWLRTEGAQTVQVDITMNGQQYTNALPFRYYPVDVDVYGLTVKSIYPNGGPVDGDTLVVVTGTRFARQAVNNSGLFCKFGESLMIPASYLNDRNIKCYAPQMAQDGDFEDHNLEVTINGQENALTSSGVPYTYYKPQGVHVSKTYPSGGPKEGNSIVTLYGTGFKRLGRYGPNGGTNGINCKFGPGLMVPAAWVSDEEITCFPPSVSTSEQCGADVVNVNVTLNDDLDSMTTDEVAYTYYDYTG